MRRDRRRHEEEDAEDDRKAFWKGLARDVIVAAIIVALFLGGMYAYAGVWPPLVVVESSSMQHGDLTSYIGVIDTGDMVFQQAAPGRSSVITYLEGRASGYMTYGDYGDVIIFRRAGSATPVIHRAIMYITLHPNNGTADVQNIADLPTTEWDARNLAGPTRNTAYLRTLRVQHMGFNRNINLTFNFATISPGADRSGYVTMGDNNLFAACGSLYRDDCGSGYDTFSIARVQDVQGRARGEIPWLGLLKLTLQPTDTCCSVWGDPEAPKNSWDSLVVTLIFLLALPFIIEYAGRGWTKYVAPRLPEIPWPWRRKPRARVSDPDEESPEADGDLEPDEPPPREGSSEP
jgi:signal peptidase